MTPRQTIARDYAVIVDARYGSPHDDFFTGFGA
jgi:hypothetical protein